MNGLREWGAMVQRETMGNRMGRAVKLSHGSMRRWEWGEFLLWLWSEGIGEGGEDGVVVAGVVGYFCAYEGGKGVGGIGGGKLDFGYC